MFGHLLAPQETSQPECPGAVWKLSSPVSKLRLNSFSFPPLLHGDFPLTSQIRGQVGTTCLASLPSSATDPLGHLGQVTPT